MIVYKIYTYPNFEEIHSGFFLSLLKEIEKLDLLSSNIQEIIITDDIEGEIERYCDFQNSKSRLTKSREFKAISKTIDFDGKKKVFFDANYLHGYSEYTPQIFYEQLIEVYAEDIVVACFKVPQAYSYETPLTDVIKMFFSQWATKTLTSRIEKQFSYKKQIIYSDIKIFTDSFKRNVRKLHYKHQEDLDLGTFWLRILNELDSYIRRSIEVKSDDGSLKNLQEFSQIIPLLLEEIEIQTNHLLDKKNIEYTLIRKYYLEILNLCFVDVPVENPMTVKISDTPKKLFKETLIDTEPRIVAFIDILGFSEIINEYDSDSSSNILNELHNTLETAVKVSIESITDSKAKSEFSEYLEYRMFSDCICLSLPYIEFGNDFHIQFQSITTVVKSYQLAMMQKGFFVRGGISIGSFYSDRNMIFSGGLVSAYRLEKATVYPVIGIDKKVLTRLSKNFKEYAKDLLFDKSLIFSSDKPEIVFINPFDILDDSSRYFDYLQTSLKSILSEEENDDLTNSILKITSDFVNPVFEFAKSQMTPVNINKAKGEILELIIEQLEKHKLRLSSSSTEEEKKEVKRIIEKFEFIHSVTEWSMDNIGSNTFKYYEL